MPIDLRNIGSIAPNSAGQIDVSSDLNLTGTPNPVYRINGVPLAMGGTPAGANTQIQYNNNGAFGASANLVWNNSQEILQLSGFRSNLQMIATAFDLFSYPTCFIGFRAPAFQAQNCAWMQTYVSPGGFTDWQFAVAPY